MKPSELKYITQEIIDKGGINVTSPEIPMSCCNAYGSSEMTPSDCTS